MTVCSRWPNLGVWAISLFFSVGAAVAATNPAGVANFHQVNEYIFRGAQPTAEGFRSLAQLGVKVVVDLRESGERSRWEKREVEGAGMRYVSVPLSGLQAPSAAHVAEVMTLLEDSPQAPVFVHCKEGKDRTGTMVACYRIGHDHWQKPKALAEAKSDGMHWFEFAMRRYIRDYNPAAANAPAVAAAPGIPTPAPALVPAQ
jgi:tyrosine-protein phosphatase SIW14